MYDYSTLIQKARSSGASPLGEFLKAMSPYVLDMVPPAGKSFGGQSLYVRVPGDMPSLIGQPPLQKSTAFLGRDNDCFVVKPEDQAALATRAKEMNRILATVFDTGLADMSASPQPNPCVDESGKPISHVGPAKVYNVGDGVTAPSIIARVDPDYPPGGTLTGQVLLALVVGEDGKPDNVHVTHGLGGAFDQNAIEAVGKWRFRPGMRFGQSVPVYMDVSVDYRDRALSTHNPARPVSARLGQQIANICRSEELFSAPPVAAATGGSGQSLGTAESGDIAIIIQKGAEASKVEFDVGRQKLIGWLSNAAFCDAGAR